MKQFHLLSLLFSIAVIVASVFALANQVGAYLHAVYYDDGQFVAALGLLFYVALIFVFGKIGSRAMSRVLA